MITPKEILEKIKRNKVESTMKPERRVTHNHQWSLIARTYAPPSMGVIDGLSDEAKQQAVMGATTILWQCTTCGETKKEIMLGSDEDTMEELMQKAELLGPQYIQRDDKTYVFMRWVPPSQQQGFTPIK